MDYPKFIVSNQKKESICIQRVKVVLTWSWDSPMNTNKANSSIFYPPDKGLL